MRAWLWQKVHLEEYVCRRVFVPECSWVIACGDCVWEIVWPRRRRSGADVRVASSRPF